MKAIVFSDEFNKCFNEKFKEFSSHESDNEYEHVNYTEFTEGINELMEAIAKNNGLSLETEFLNLDYAFFQPKKITMDIAVEHENSPLPKRRKYNFRKLLNVNAPLKVLICYYKKNEKPDLKARFYKNLFDTYGQTNSEFVLLLGYYRLEEAKDNAPKE